VPLPERPLESIFALVLRRGTQAGIKYSLLGTAFYAGEEGESLTAAHVLQGIALEPDDSVEGVFPPFDGSTNRRVVDFRLSNRYDVAVGRTDDTGPTHGLTLAEEDHPINLDVLTVEFSGTRSFEDSQGRRGMMFKPYFRKGHIICRSESDWPNPGTSTLELSFPTLRGASGAPVVVDSVGVVAGMIIANVERELLPAHVETTYRDGALTEEIRLPPANWAGD
jgi:Trypsin-like peptidase domain